MDLPPPSGCLPITVAVPVGDLRVGTGLLRPCSQHEEDLLSQQDREQG